LEKVDGPLKRIAAAARSNPDQKYVIIIDEINRGNLSKIFGELMLLIESDKRGEHYAVSLTYSANSETFYVPNNVYIIGTMNTADRSLAVVDYALRRRFSFIHIHPNFEEKLRNYLSTILDKKLVNKIAERLTALNRQIKSDPQLGDGFMIGHSYFCNLQKSENHDSWYEDIVKFEIEPLLKEYWFDDLEKANTAAEKLLE
jgi:5-methylcytosine-specific restriction protein B